MSETKYTYAVAQIRALEPSLLSQAEIEQLLEEVIREHPAE